MGNVRITPYMTSGDHSATAISSTVVPKTKPAGADAAMLQALTADIYFTIDGTDPNAGSTPPVGFLLDSSALGPIVLTTGENVTTLKFVRVSGDGVLQLQWLTSY
jgi:hypothetical protein